MSDAIKEIRKAVYLLDHNKITLGEFEERLRPWHDVVPMEDYQSMERTVEKLTKAISEAEPIRHRILDEMITCRECYHHGTDEYGYYCLYIDVQKGTIKIRHRSTDYCNKGRTNYKHNPEVSK